jgi:hypothetical protein
MLSFVHKTLKFAETFRYHTFLKLKKAGFLFILYNVLVLKQQASTLSFLDPVT